MTRMTIKALTVQVLSLTASVACLEEQVKALSTKPVSTKVADAAASAVQATKNAASITTACLGTSWAVIKELKRTDLFKVALAEAIKSAKGKSATQDQIAAAGIVLIRNGQQVGTA